MSTIILSLENLITRCNYLESVQKPYYDELNEAFHILNLTGCRIQEIFEIERWSIVSGYNVTLQPQKGNNLRYITLDSDCDNFISNIVNQTKPFLGRTDSQFSNVYDKVATWSRQESGDKKITFYLFRYKYIKKLYSEGKTASEIATEMGYTTSSVVQNYLSAEITEMIDEPPAGFVQIGNVLWSLSNCSLDDGGEGIVSNNLGNDSIWGLYYSYDAAMRICASIPGAELPSLQDFSNLIPYLNSQNKSLASLKLTGFNYFKQPNAGAENYLNFSILGTGYFRNSALLGLNWHASLILAGNDGEYCKFYLWFYDAATPAYSTFLISAYQSCFRYIIRV
jgi:uncharacterized protein (TIGR02145 family)